MIGSLRSQPANPILEVLAPQGMFTAASSHVGATHANLSTWPVLSDPGSIHLGLSLLFWGYLSSVGLVFQLTYDLSSNTCISLTMDKLWTPTQKWLCYISARQSRAHTRYYSCFLLHNFEIAVPYLSWAIFLGLAENEVDKRVMMWNSVRHRKILSGVVSVLKTAFLRQNLCSDNPP